MAIMSDEFDHFLGVLETLEEFVLLSPRSHVNYLIIAECKHAKMEFVINEEGIEVLNMLLLW